MAKLPTYQEHHIGVSNHETEIKEMEMKHNIVDSNNSYDDWYFINQENIEEKCNDKLNQIFNNLSINHSTQYKIGKWEYKAKKTSSTIIEQINLKTNTKRDIYKKFQTNIDNNNMYNHSNLNTYWKTKNNNVHLWGFINENNVLIKVDQEYQQFLNLLNVNETAITKKIYSVCKISYSHAQQTNTQTKTVRQLYSVLLPSDHNNYNNNYNNNCNNSFATKVCIDESIGVKMIKELFFRSVDKNAYKIDKMEKIDYKDETLYHTMYEKYKRQYQDNKSLERWLFHGTDTTLLKQIEINGFDRNFNKTSRYGKVEYIMCFMRGFVCLR